MTGKDGAKFKREHTILRMKNNYRKSLCKAYFFALYKHRFFITIIMFCSELTKSVSAYRYVQMYHTNTEEDIQEKIIAHMGDPDGEIRVLIATIAFGMGVNVKGMHIAIMIGRPSELYDYLQMAGKIGRDGKQSMCLTVKYPGVGILLERVFLNQWKDF